METANGKRSINVGLVGYGYWGPNLARNFSAQPGCRLSAICELDPDRAALAGRMFPGTRILADYEAMLADPELEAVLVATPVGSHYELVRRALLAGKDVLVEKPLTQTSAQAAELVALAEERGRVLAVDHTFLFTGAVRKIKELSDAGDLGELLYFDSVRVNLGLFQQDVNVVFDLAPHDLAILHHLVGRSPSNVRAVGLCHGGGVHECVAYLHLEYEGGFMAHFHFSWLAPVKIRKTILAGTRKMVVYDDMEITEKVKIYDKGVVVNPDRESLYKIHVDYRTGDMLAPKLVHREALAAEAAHFLDCVRDRSLPLASGRDGLAVVRILEAAAESLARGGDRVELAPEECA